MLLVSNFKNNNTALCLILSVNPNYACLYSYGITSRLFIFTTLLFSTLDSGSCALLFESFPCSYKVAFCILFDEHSR